MEIEFVSSEFYQSKITNTRCIYNKINFIELNSYKVDKVEYLLFKDVKYRFGLILGIKNSKALCPFSAPFAFLEEIKKCKIEELVEAIYLLDKHLLKNGYHFIKFILPPSFYYESYLEKLINALYINKYTVSNIDLDFYISIPEICNGSYIKNIHKNAQSGLKTALKSNLTFKKCINEEEKKEVYNIIKLNHESKRYPLHMTYKQVIDTTNIVSHDFFKVSCENEDIAAALTYYVTPEIVQVIYWGNKPGFSQKNSMNYIIYEMIQYYNERHIKILDIGPSTEDSKPNFGLCNFKESIGCKVSTKLSFEKNIE